MKKNTKQLFIAVLLLSSTLAFAAPEEPKPEASTATVATEDKGQKAIPAVSYNGTAASADVLATVSAKPALRTKLPKDIIAYIRIPSLWGFLSAPKGTRLDKALRDSEHVKLIAKLQAALFKNILKGNGDGLKNGLTFLFHDMQAPLEVVVLPSNKSSVVPMPYVVLHTKARFKSVKQASDALNAFLSQAPMFKVLAPMNKAGRALVQFGPMPGFVDYSVKTGELYIGVGYAKTQVDAALTQFKPATHDIHALEVKVDQSGQGYFAWVNVKNLLVQVKPMMPPSVYQQITLSQISKIALGWGVYNGKSRIKVVAESPFDLSPFTSVMGNDIKLLASGKPTYFVGFAVPGPKQWATFKPMITGMLGPRFIKMQETFKKESGLSFDDIINVLGPQMYFFGDDLGDYVVMQLRDPAKFEQMMQTVISATKAKYKTYTVKGKTIHYVAASGGKLDPLVMNQMPLALRMMSRQSSHIYWMVEGNYVLMTGAPQLLRDRINTPNPIAIGTWLKQKQKQDFEKSVVLMSFSTSGVSKLMYTVYLQSLHILGDAIGEPIEINQLPSHRELNMASTGTYGLQFNVAKNQVSAELVFENNPLEFMLDAKIVVAVAVTVALVGVPRIFR